MTPRDVPRIRKYAAAEAARLNARKHQLAYYLHPHGWDGLMAERARHPEDGQ